MRRSRTEAIVEALTTDPQLSEIMIGDLTQAGAELSEDVGTAAAQRWPARQVLRSVPSLMLQRLRQAPVHVVLTALLAGPLIMVVVDFLANARTGGLLNGLGDGWLSTTVPLALEGVTGLLAGLVAGALVARTSRWGGLATALWVVPSWLLWMLVAVPVVTYGGVAVGAIPVETIGWRFPLGLPFELAGLLLGSVLSTLRRRPAGRAQTA